jgi:hypothetical protein
MSRRSEAIRLRTQGLTLQEVGQRLGISRQDIHALLKGETFPRPGIVCQQCGQAIAPRHGASQNIGPVFCLDCLPADELRWKETCEAIQTCFAQTLSPSVARCATIRKKQGKALPWLGLPYPYPAILEAATGAHARVDSRLSKVPGTRSILSVPSSTESASRGRALRGASTSRKPARESYRVWAMIFSDCFSNPS